MLFLVQIAIFINQKLSLFLSMNESFSGDVCSRGLLKMIDVYKIIEKVKKTGKIEKGTNEVTKAIERATAKFVVFASDVEPKEIVQHIPLLCKEKQIPFKEVDSKQKLGIVAGVNVPTSSIAIIDVGEAEKEIAGLK